jgi:hypothetical protein
VSFKDGKMKKGIKTLVLQPCQRSRLSSDEFPAPPPHPGRDVCERGDGQDSAID